MLNTLVSPDYSLTNNHLLHIASNCHNHCPISVILTFIPQDSIFQVYKNKMDNKSDDQLLIMQTRIDASSQYSYDKTKKLIEDPTEMIESIMDQIKI